MIREIEELSMNAWPSLQTNLYDGWVLRFADGFTKRANCVNPLYESTIALDEKIDWCEKAYRLRGLPVLFKITPATVALGLDARLEERGYVRENEVSLRVLRAGEYIRSEPRDIVVDPRFTDDWLEGFFHCSSFRRADRAVTRKILANIVGPVVCVSKRRQDRIVGCGYGAVERGRAGVFNVVVAKDCRGRGFARDIMDGILGEVFPHADTAYLQVLAGNSPAEKLYDKFGFRELYRYWYRRAGMVKVF